MANLSLILGKPEFRISEKWAVTVQQVRAFVFTT